jgi:hypothetical protein
MDEPAKTGTPWRDDELDLIVADYFAMLGAELSGHPYVKSQHNAAIMAQTGRSRGSVEFKYQNISALLDALGMPWIPGYLPRKNYQNAIFQAIDRYLTQHPRVLNLDSPAPPVRAPANIFVEPPVFDPELTPVPDGLLRLVRKFDPVERDYRNRSLGNAGEQFVLELERRHLTETSRPDLARKVRWISAEDGDGAGFDILSFDPAGQERLLEVKTTNGSARTPFFLTRTECETASERPDHWRIYRVHLFASNPRIFTIAPPIDQALALRAELWRASFSGSAKNTP